MKYPGHLVKAGERNATIVRAVKKRLNDTLKLSTDAKTRLDETDPTFSEQTTKRVKLFQARHVDASGRPLLQDGRIGAITWAALFGESAVPSAVQAATAYLARAVQIAAQEAATAVREVPANSNRGPRVEEYQTRAGSPKGLAWCASFVYWCFDEAAKALGRPDPVVRTAGVLKHWQQSGEAGAKRILKAQAIENPALLKPGMIFVMSHGAGLGHTGIIESVNGGLLSTIEGNTDASKTREGGGVYRLTRKVTEINVGFIDYSVA
jgi:CHAP domain